MNKAIFSESWKKFKKDFVFIIAIDFLTILFAFLILFLARGYLGSLVGSLSYIDGNLIINEESIGSIAGSLSGIIGKFNFIFYFLLPAGLFLVIEGLQAVSFGIASERSKKAIRLKYIFRFMVYSLFSFLLGIVILTELVNVMSYALLGEGSMDIGYGFLIVYLLMIITRYFTLIAYGMMLEKNNVVEEALTIGVKKAYAFLPVTIGIGISKLAIVISLFGFLLSVIGENTSIASLIIFLASLPAMAYLKVLNAVMAKHYQQLS